MDFKGKVAIVTGSGSPRGIGREIIRAFAEKGCAVVAADMDFDGARQNAVDIEKNYGVDTMAVSVNVTEEASVKAMLEAVFKRFGRIDIMCNNAGITQPVTIENMGYNDFMRIVNVNLVGTFLCSKHVVPYMVKGGYGRIVNTSSVSAKCGGGVYGGAHYCAAKAGIIGFTRAQAFELCKQYKDMITVNCVCPGLIATDIRTALSDEKEKEARDKQAMGRAGTAREVADTIVWLASDEASYISGEDVNINGASYFG